MISSNAKRPSCPPVPCCALALLMLATPVTAADRSVVPPVAQNEARDDTSYFDPLPAPDTRPGWVGGDGWEPGVPEIVPEGSSGTEADRFGAGDLDPDQTVIEDYGFEPAPSSDENAAAADAAAADAGPDAGSKRRFAPDGPRHAVLDSERVSFDFAASLAGPYRSHVGDGYRLVEPVPLASLEMTVSLDRFPADARAWLVTSVRILSRIDGVGALVPVHALLMVGRDAAPDADRTSADAVPAGDDEPPEPELPVVRADIVAYGPGTRERLVTTTLAVSRESIDAADGVRLSLRIDGEGVIDVATDDDEVSIRVAGDAERFDTTDITIVPWLSGPAGSRGRLAGEVDGIVVNGRVPGSPDPVE